MYRVSHFRAALAAFCLLSGSAATAAAESAWTLERGGYAFENTFLLRSTKEVYDAEGVKVAIPDAKLSEFSSVASVEYGLRNKVGFVFQVPIRSLNWKPTQAGEPNLRNSGLSDLTFGLRYRAVASAAVASLQADAIIPTGYSQAYSVPALGNGKFQYGARALVGRTFAAIRGYLQVSGGYRVVTGEPADLWLAGAELGAFVASPVRVRALWHWNREVGDDPFTNEFGGRLTGDYRISDKVQLSAGADRTFGGQNVDAGTYFFLGFSVRGNSLGKFEGPLSSTLEAGASE